MPTVAELTAVTGKRADPQLLTVLKLSAKSVSDCVDEVAKGLAVDKAAPPIAALYHRICVAGAGVAVKDSAVGLTQVAKPEGVTELNDGDAGRTLIT